MRISRFSRNYFLNVFHPDTIEEFNLNSKRYLKVLSCVKNYHLPKHLKNDAITMLTTLKNDGNNAVAESAAALLIDLKLDKPSTKYYVGRKLSRKLYLKFEVYYLIYDSQFRTEELLVFCSKEFGVLDMDTKWGVSHYESLDELLYVSGLKVNSKKLFPYELIKLGNL